MTDSSRSQSRRQGCGSGEAIPPWTCALACRGRDGRAAAWTSIASGACVLRRGPTRWQAGAARQGRDPRAAGRRASRSVRRWQPLASWNPPPMDHPRRLGTAVIGICRRRRRGITALAAWICCRCPASVRVYREQHVSRNDTWPPTSFARRIPDGKGSWEIFEKKGKQSALVDGRNRNGSDGSGTRGR